MRFSDMMGSGEERALKSSEQDTAISDALAPYLDAPTTAETAVAVEAAVESTIGAAREAAAETRSAEPAPRPHTVEAVFPVIPVPAEAIAPAPAIERAQIIAAHESAAAAIPDFTPLSDDLLPRRRK